MATAVSGAEDEGGEMHLFPPRDPEDSVGLRRGVHRFRAMPEGAPGGRGLLLRPRLPLPGLRRDRGPRRRRGSCSSTHIEPAGILLILLNPSGLSLLILDTLLDVQDFSNSLHEDTE